MTNELGGYTLEALKELCEKATAGRWYISLPTIRIGKEGGKHGYLEVSSEESILWVARVQAFTDGPIDKASSEWEANAQFIAAARKALPAALQRIAELERDADKVKAFNLLLTAISPTVRRLAERYLEGVKDMDHFIEFLRTHPLPEPPR